MDASGPKRRKLNYDKCTPCRNAKKRCDPPNRQLPQRCERCEKMDLECSQNKNLKTSKPSPETAERSRSRNSVEDGNNETQMLQKCQDLELELSWIRCHENYTARVQLINKAIDVTSMDVITDLGFHVKWRKTEILQHVSKFLDCPSPLVRQAALSVVSRLTSRRPAEYAENEFIRTEDTFRALLESLKSSDRIDIELSMRECLLRAMLVRKAPHQDIVDSVRVYSEACERYMLRVHQLRLGQVEMDFYDEGILPFSGDTQMLSLLMRYCPDILFRPRDSHWYNALAAAISSAKQKDVEQLFQNMEDDIMLKLVTPNGRRYRVLHTAAVRGMNCVFDRLRALDRDSIKSGIDSTDASNTAPLSHAAANGNHTIVEILLELGADPGVADDNNQVALHHAAWNGNEDIVRQLLLNDPGLCTRQDRYGDTPAALAVERGYHKVTKVFFSQPCRSLLENDEEIGEDIWLHLLGIAFAHGYPQTMDLLRYDQFVGQIDRKDQRLGQTALGMAAEVGNLDAVKFLLSQGADPSIADDGGKTPCDYARRNGYHQVVSVFEELLPPAVRQ